MLTDNTLVIWNPGAGSAEKADELAQRLHADDRVDVLSPDSHQATLEAVCEQAANYTRVIAAGGDGTVNAVIAGVVEASADTLIGVIPLGTGNDLARSLEVPLDPQAAWDLIEQNTETRRLDVLKYRTATQSGICVNMLTGGNTGRYLNEMTDEIKQRWGPLSYLRGVVDVLRDMRSYHIQITYANGGSEVFDAVNFFLANGKTSGGGLTVSADARLDDGLCELVIVQEGTAREIASLAAEYVMTAQMQHDLVVTRRVSELILSSDRDMLLTGDGESIGQTPLRVKLLPRAVRVLAGFPASAPIPATDDIPAVKSTTAVPRAARLR